MRQLIKSPAPTKQLGKNKELQKHSTILDAQRKRILNWLAEGHSLNTFQARELLDIMHPGGRIMELRRKGWCIKMRWVTVDKGLSEHRIGQYFLSSSKAED